MTTNRHVEEFKKQIKEAEKAEKARIKAETGRVRKAVNARKKNSTKPRLSETLTFGLLITEAQVKHYTGFIYKITLTHPRAPGLQYTYIGKKGFTTGADWHYYMSSGEKVMEKLNAGWEPSYEVISFESTSQDMSRAEASRIVLQWQNGEDRKFNLNMSVVLHGVKWTRYKFCKQFLKVVDKTY